MTVPHGADGCLINPPVIGGHLGPPRPKAGAVPQVQLYFWHLDRPPSQVERLSSYLAADERQRTDRFAHALHASRFIVGRGRLREILAAHSNQSPHAVRFRYGPHGKPFLEDAPQPLFFNLSHSGPLAMLGLCSIDLGVDVEIMRELSTDAEQFLSPQEQVALARLPPNDRMRGFYRGWTCKEAMVKALGGGLSIALDDFDVSLRPDEPARLLRLAEQHGDLDRWSLVGLQPAECCFAAIAVSSPCVTVVIAQNDAADR